jgi:hypothetical protein
VPYRCLVHDEKYMQRVKSDLVLILKELKLSEFPLQFVCPGPFLRVTPEVWIIEMKLVFGVTRDKRGIIVHGDRLKRKW